jgi:hypothetical protein
MSDPIAYGSDGWPFCPACHGNALVGRDDEAAPTDPLTCEDCGWSGTVPPAGWENIVISWPGGPAWIHILPIKDSMRHTLIAGTCECHPQIEHHGRKRLVIHQAFDGRDLVEQHGVN